jgi:hypothetical protein
MAWVRGHSGLVSVAILLALGAAALILFGGKDSGDTEGSNRLELTGEQVTSRQARIGGFGKDAIFLSAHIEIPPGESDVALGECPRGSTFVGQGASSTGGLSWGRGFTEWTNRRGVVLSATNSANAPVRSQLDLVCEAHSASARKLAEKFQPPPSSRRGNLVSGSNGKAIRCSDGKLLRVKGNDVPPPGIVRVGPSRRTEEGGEEVEVLEGAVPRCGPQGGGQNGTPIWVPESVGRGITEAPARYVKQQSD